MTPNGFQAVRLQVDVVQVAREERVRGGKRWFKLKKGRAWKNISFLKNNTDFKLRDQNCKKMVL